MAGDFANGLEFLKALSKQSGKQEQSYRPFSRYLDHKDLMHQAWEAGMIYSTLTGGECLAYPGFNELYLYLRGLGCDPSILTNGYFLDERQIEFFQQVNARSLASSSCSSAWPSPCS